MLLLYNFRESHELSSLQQCASDYSLTIKYSISYTTASVKLYHRKILTKMLITTAVDNILKHFPQAKFVANDTLNYFILFFYFFFSEKVSLDISHELSAWQTIHINCNLFSLKN